MRRQEKQNALITGLNRECVELAKWKHKILQIEWKQQAIQLNAEINSIIAVDVPLSLHEPHSAVCASSISIYLDPD